MGTQADDTQIAETMTADLSSALPGWREGIPLVRILSCGPFTIEVLQEVPGGDATQTRYAPLPPERLHGRGPAPALTFLKLLVSQKDRYAPKDWLIEHLRGDEYLITPKRLENIVSFVRQFLDLPDGTRPPGMLRYVRASHESGDGYRLAPYPLIWLDVDALAAHVRQACLLERFGDDPLPSWERASQLVCRGTYLAEEPYSQWADSRRTEVEGHLRQCVHALSRLWLARYGASAEEEVLHLLRSYWSSHPEDEDVAWGLMDLLGRRGRYQEALEVYACLEQSLEGEGLTKDGKPRVPDQRTRDLADYLRLKERQPLLIRPPRQETVLLSSVGALAQQDGIPVVPAGKIELPLSPTDQSMLSIPIWNIPYYRNPFFTGREDVLTHLHNVLNRRTSGRGTAPLALCGLGGIGKTQCALEYTYRYAHEYQAVFWVKADTRENLLADFLSIASLLHLPEQSAEDRVVTVAAVQRWFQSQERWLLILDNVDDLTLVLEFLPSGQQGHVLFTTRMQALGGLAHSVQIEEMDQETGALFLLRRAGLCPPDTSRFDTTTASARIAQALVQELGGLPLALDQAGAYIEETSSDLQAYLDSYHSSRQALLERRGGITMDHPESVATTWTLAFSRIESSDPLAASLLHLCAFLDPDAISEELLFVGLQHLAGSSTELRYLGFNEALGSLLRFSLIKRNADTHTVTVHRLIQSVVRDHLLPEHRLAWIHRVIHLLAELFPSAMEVTNWPRCEKLLPHALLCAQWIEQADITSINAAALLDTIGYYLNMRARYDQARPLFERALRIREHVLGEQHPDTAQTLSNLAYLYHHQDKFEQAMHFLKRALLTRQQVLGVQHPDTATSLNALALLYRDQGKYEEAKTFFQQALAIREQIFGAQHPQTAHSLSNLAWLYRNLGNYQEAERLYERSLLVRRRLLGIDHPDTATSLNGLALLYAAQKNYAKAETLFHQAITIRQSVLGTNHLHTTQSMNALALLYRDKGEYEKAEPLLVEVLAVREHILGHNHPRTATSIHNLAFLYYYQGKFEQAESLFQRALTIREHLFGPEHPATLAVLKHLAQCQKQVQQRGSRRADQPIPSTSEKRPGETSERK